ncbi:MAG: chitobiase/beta-hexosaminidase C-terminal domain-containing protein [Treponema sp.]|nr:chitobiase/beta-hexosaminidase C-terminal domain-containing protein [Treponema sp.]
MGKSLGCFLVLLFVFLVPAAALERVISPVPGIWSNRQSLVLNTRDGAECFYSYSGTDPLTSGFIYDGPVLIDATGPVTVRIVCVDRAGRREEYQVSYTVTSDDIPFEEGSIERNFIETIVSHPLYLFTSGQRLTIPESLFYSMGDGLQPLLAGRMLTIDAENRLSRYIPCIVTTTESAQNAPQWRFVIFLSGGEAGTLAKYDVPFRMKSWTTLVFENPKFIYAIDDGLWSASKEPQVIDRSVSHTVYWQSIAYEKGNPIQSFELPPKPELTVRAVKKHHGPVIFSIDGDSRYRMEIVSSGNDTDAASSDGLFTQVAFDTFFGDAIGGDAVFSLFCDGVYQGDISCAYDIDKKPPLPPVIKPSEKAEYARRSVDLSFEAESGAKIYYALSEGTALDELTDVDMLMHSVQPENYVLYGTPSVRLASGDNTALFYKVYAYAIDEAGNTGAKSSYSVVIDEYNYYLSESAENGGDGSRRKPFNSFSELLPVINGGRYARVFVSGTIALPSGETVLTSNSSFTSLENARFVLPADGVIVVRSASLGAENCTFEKSAPSGKEKKASSSFFMLENAAVSFTGCELVSVYDSNGTAFSASNSVIDFTDSGLTAQAGIYGCGISANESKIAGKNSRFTVLAPTAVNFSVQGGLFELRGCECKVVSHLGRVAELSRTHARLTGNRYIGQFDTKTSRVSPVWNDSGTLLLEDSKNQSEGF